MRIASIAVFSALAVGVVAAPQQDQQAQKPAAFAVVADTLHTVTGAKIANGMVLIRDGKIAAVGEGLKLPTGIDVVRAKVVTPGLIDAHSTVGLTGVLNVPHDQDQLEKSSPMQPELRALDAYHPRDPLVAWVRSLGVTTLHTGHGPGALISGQTMVIKTHGTSVDADVVKPFAMMAVTLADAGRSREGKAPGTRAKSVAMLREKLIEARGYMKKRAGDADAPIDLGLEAMAGVLRGEVPLLVTAHRAHDLASALRVAKEFEVRVVLDGAAEAYLMLPQIKQANVWVLPHPAMARTRRDLENGTMELAAKLFEAKVPFAMQSGYEAYVPKTRVVLWEAGVSIMHGLAADAALRALTIDAAKLCGVDKRVGSIEVGKDADLALFDGDPFEYTTHCLGAIVDGKRYLGSPR